MPSVTEPRVFGNRARFSEPRVFRSRAPAAHPETTGFRALENIDSKNTGRVARAQADLQPHHFRRWMILERVARVYHQPGALQDRGVIEAAVIGNYGHAVGLGG
jgi:hypothetical protein